MSFSQKIQSLRNKPQRVKERILLVSLAVAAAGLFVVWYVTFHHVPGTGGLNFIKDIGRRVTTSFSNPVYTKVLGDGTVPK